jgi:acyl-CoA thioesterase-1
MQWLPVGFAFLGLLGLNSARAAGGLACDMPPELIAPANSLPHVATGLAKGNVNILALGSGSTVGDASGAGGPALAFHAPDASFPHRMVEALQAYRPGVQFAISVQGGRNMTAEAMLPMLRQELAAHRYDLVLWQTGTVEAVHGLRTDGLRDVLEDGSDLAAAAGVDLILIDPQFSRFLRANADVSPYETVLQQVSGAPGASLFRRYDLTQLWVDNGQIDLERVGRDERDKTIELLNTCLGEALARFVLAGAAAH